MRIYIHHMVHRGAIRNKTAVRGGGRPPRPPIAPHCIYCIFILHLFYLYCTFNIKLFYIYFTFIGHKHFFTFSLMYIYLIYCSLHVLYRTFILYFIVPLMFIHCTFIVLIVQLLYIYSSLIVHLLY